MPYRIDLPQCSDDALDRLISVGALDVEAVGDGLAALMPDGVSATVVADALGIDELSVSDAIGRDDGSVWILSPRAVQVGRFSIVPASMPAPDGAIRITDGPAFGTGLHQTTVLCLEAIDELLDTEVATDVLDVGTGSGVLALAALTRGVARAVGLDVDADALAAAAENAHLNGVAGRLELVHGGPDAVHGTWPLVVANVLAAPLMEMAPALVRRVGHRGRLVLSGISWSVAEDVEQVYRRLGMRLVRSETRAGWTLIVLAPSW